MPRNNLLATLRRECGGQTTVEFAFSMGFMLVLILGIVELILFLYTYNVLAGAAKEGVRYAIVHGSNMTTSVGPTCPPCPSIDGDPGTGVVKTYAQASLHDTSAMTVTVDYNPNGQNGGSACNTKPCLVRVTVNYTYQPFFGFGWPTIPVTAVAEGRVVY